MNSLPVNEVIARVRSARSNLAMPRGTRRIASGAPPPRNDSLALVLVLASPSIVSDATENPPLNHYRDSAFT
jgi:hypothetical protein